MTAIRIPILVVFLWLYATPIPARATATTARLACRSCRRRRS